MESARRGWEESWKNNLKMFKKNDFLFEIFTGLKSNGIPSFDLNLLTSLGIMSHPGFSINFLEGAKTD